jgi:hypothetical protein
MNFHIVQKQRIKREQKQKNKKLFYLALLIWSAAAASRSNYHHQSLAAADAAIHPEWMNALSLSLVYFRVAMFQTKPSTILLFC